MKILLATHNKNKIKEFKMLIKDYDYNLITLDDLNDFDEVIEDGISFYENAYLKAKYFAKKHNIITIADDSGLSVNALLGRPGINSARYSNNYELSNNELLLKEMDGIKNRRASFVCSLVIYLPNENSFDFKGTIDGLITNKEIGQNGFGYDPVFYVKQYNKTFAQLSSDIKNTISHRAIAFKKGIEKLNEIINN